MTIQRLTDLVEGRLFAGNANNEVTRFYCGDFLSQVMASAPPSCAWLTIMNNLNVAGVAVIADIKVVIICEGIEPMPELVKKCADESIALIAASLPIFECCIKIASEI